MSLQFITGASGSGKSTYIDQQIIARSEREPEGRFFILVPDQFTMQTQKDLVMQHPNHGIMNIDVLSFVRLAYRIFEETGGQALPVLDDEGKNLILRKIAGDYEKDLKLHDKLIENGHLSPLEHICQCLTEEEYQASIKTVGFYNGRSVIEEGWCSNLKGFKSYRYMVENGIYESYK